MMYVCMYELKCMYVTTRQVYVCMYEYQRYSSIMYVCMYVCSVCTLYVDVNLMKHLVCVCMYVCMYEMHKVINSLSTKRSPLCLQDINAYVCMYVSMHACMHMYVSISICMYGRTDSKALVCGAIPVIVPLVRRNQGTPVGDNSLSSQEKPARSHYRCGQIQPSVCMYVCTVCMYVIYTVYVYLFD